MAAISALSIISSFPGFHLAYLASFLLAVVVATNLALPNSAGFVVVGVEVGKFIEILFVQMGEFNRKIVEDWKIGCGK
jgi:hypothetical protein